MQAVVMINLNRVLRLPLAVDCRTLTPTHTFGFLSKTIISTGGVPRILKVSRLSRDARHRLGDVTSRWRKPAAFFLPFEALSGGRILACAVYIG